MTLYERVFTEGRTIGVGNYTDAAVFPGKNVPKDEMLKNLRRLKKKRRKKDKRQVKTKQSLLSPPMRKPSPERHRSASNTARLGQNIL